MVAKSSEKKSTYRDLSGLVIRVDDRLFHGQILYGWAQNWADEVWLVNDKVAEDPSERALYEEQIAQVRHGGVLTVNEAVERYNDRKCVEEGKHCLVILGNVQDLKRLVGGGASPSEIHLANLGKAEDRVQVADTVFISRDDGRILRNLRGEGYDICLRKLPQSKVKPVELPE